MIKAEELTGKMETMFTHILPDGTNVHIASERLRKWCVENKPRIRNVPVEEQIVAKFIVQNVISRERVKYIIKHSYLLFDPVIFCKDGQFTNGKPDAFFVDGHHRYAAAYYLERPYVPAWVLALREWYPFRIEGLGNLDHEQLFHIPTRQGHHK